MGLLNFYKQLQLDREEELEFIRVQLTCLSVKLDDGILKARVDSLIKYVIERQNKYNENKVNEEYDDITRKIRDLQDFCKHLGDKKYGL